MNTEMNRQREASIASFQNYENARIKAMPRVQHTTAQSAPEPTLTPKEIELLAEHEAEAQASVASLQRFEAAQHTAE